MTTQAGFTAFSQYPATYNGDGFTAANIRNILNRDYDIYEEGDQLPRRAIAITVQVDDVPESRFGDTIARNGKTWRVNEILDDDGYSRVLEVY